MAAMPSRLVSCEMKVRILISLWAIFSARGQFRMINSSSSFSSSAPDCHIFFRAERTSVLRRFRKPSMNP